MNVYTLSTSSDAASFSLVDPTANRYTKIQNVTTSGYLNFAGDSQKSEGWYVLDWSDGTASNTWVAGFLPVEVITEDNIYEARIKVPSNQMLSSRATLIPYTAGNISWKVEQTDDYAHFLLKNYEGKYFVGVDQPLSETEGEATVLTNADLNQWTLEFFINSIWHVPYEITHRESYLRQYTNSHDNNVLRRQGLAYDADSEWMNDDGTQNVNQFMITHYVKRGQTVKVSLPTIQNTSNDHVAFQRWYNLNNPTDLYGFMEHVSLNANGSVAAYLYNNGVVTGTKLYWDASVTDTKVAKTAFNFTNTDGTRLNVAVDVSRYSDYTYANNASKLEGDLEEPSLTMRYIFYMRDAKDIAKKLTACTEGSDQW